MKRKLYRDLYEVRAVMDPSTGKERKQASYRGKFYCLAMDPAGKRKLGAELALLLLAAILLYVVCGLMNLPSSRSFYVLPFYLAMTFPLFYASMAVFRFFRLPPAFTEIQKAECVDSLSHSCVGLMALSGLYLLGDLLFLAAGNKSRLGEELWGLACAAGIGVLAALAKRGMEGAGTAPCSQEP